MEDLRERQGVLGEPVAWNSSAGGGQMGRRDETEHVRGVRSRAMGCASLTFD